MAVIFQFNTAAAELPFRPDQYEALWDWSNGSEVIPATRKQARSVPVFRGPP
jgi:hypothetical protein